MEPIQNLRSRILRAGAWTMIEHFFGQALRLGSSLVMTRLLVPEMFGLIAIASIFVGAMHLFSDIGLRQKIIQSERGNEPIFLNTAWTVQVIRGFIICVVTLGLAGLATWMNSIQMWPTGSVYADPILPQVIAVLSFGAVIGGFNSTKLITASREMMLGRRTRILLIGQFGGIVFQIAWALRDPSIWAIVFGILFSIAIVTVLTHLVLQGVPNRLKFDLECFQELFHFGKWIFITSALAFFTLNGDRILLGWVVDPATLGLYAIAFVFVAAIQNVISKLIAEVSLPALSEIARNRPTEMAQVYYKFRTPIDIFSLVTMGFIFVTGDLIIQVLYDDRYLLAGHMLQIICLVLFTERYNLVEQCFIALGHPKLLIPIKVTNIISFLILFPFSYIWFGLEGALWSIGVSRLFALPVIFYLKNKYGLLRYMKEFRILLAVIVGAVFGALVEMVFIEIGL